MAKMYSETQSIPQKSSGVAIGERSDVAPEHEGLDAAGQMLPEDFIRLSFPVPYHRDAIFAAYKGGLRSILATAAACLAAEKALDPSQKQALLKDLPFRPPSFSKYVSIGRDSRLSDPKVSEKLPPKFTVLYLLSRLSKEEFIELQEQGLLRCGLRRTELEQWIRIRGTPKIGKPKLFKLGRAFAAAFKPLSGLRLADEAKEDFRSKLAKLGAEFGMEMVFPADECMTNQDQALNYIREEGRKVVEHFIKQKRQKQKSYAGKIPSYLRKNPAAAYGDIWIDHSAGVEKVQDILALIGREKEFKLIRAAAFDAYGIPNESDERSAALDAPDSAEAASVDEQSAEKSESSI